MQSVSENGLFTIDKVKIMSELIKLIEAESNERRKKFPAFKAGDTVNIHVKITEGNKERIQQFQGTVIQKRNPSTNGETFTVRKISNGVGVERVFPLLSPSVERIEIIKTGSVRRARLFYLRNLMGKAARIKDGKVQAKEAMAEVVAYEKMLKEQEEASIAAQGEIAAKEAAEAAKAVAQSEAAAQVPEVAEVKEEAPAEAAVKEEVAETPNVEEETPAAEEEAKADEPTK